MLATINSAAIIGIEGMTIQVQVDVGTGLARFLLAGLPDAAVKESEQRVPAAIRNSNFAFPSSRITINLAPADVHKEGPSFDLPIAIGVLAATEQIAVPDLDRFAVVGELSLDGGVRPVSGVLPIAMATRNAHLRCLIVPAENAPEATVVNGIDVYPVRTLWEAAEVISQPSSRVPAPPVAVHGELENPHFEIDFSDVKGQLHAKRALEVAAAGGHNVLMVGPPGSGKTMLAKRLPSILPPLSFEEALEVSKIYSISGKLPRSSSLISTRPFRAPHHTISTAGLAGGGAIPKPGEISLCHHGVLFLDELPEFNRDALESLRQPLEEGVVSISRAAAAYTYPAQLTLVAALNPCPCGFFTDASRSCSCTPHQIQRYLRRISGPLLDRVDIHIEIPRLQQQELLSTADGEASEAVRKRVEAARQIQRDRFHGTRIFCNAHMSPRQLREFCPLDEESKTFLRGAIEQLSLSARAFDRIVKLSRTIADMDGAADIGLMHISEAINYRSLDRRLWG